MNAWIVQKGFRKYIQYDTHNHNQASERLGRGYVNLNDRKNIALSGGMLYPMLNKDANTERLWLISFYITSKTPE